MPHRAPEPSVVVLLLASLSRLAVTVSDLLRSRSRLIGSDIGFLCVSILTTLGPPLRTAMPSAIDRHRAIKAEIVDALMFPRDVTGPFCCFLAFPASTVPRSQPHIKIATERDEKRIPDAIPWARWLYIGRESKIRSSINAPKAFARRQW